MQTEKELFAKGLSTDNFTAALMNGVQPEDGGEVGTPIEVDGNGDCLLNSVSAFFAKAGTRGARSAINVMALKLRLSLLINGLKYMEVFLLDQEEHFGAWYNYTSVVREQLVKNGWHVHPDTSNNWRVGSADCARLLYVAQLRHIARQGVWLQQFVFPILATVVQSYLRVFLPCELFLPLTQPLVLCVSLSASAFPLGTVWMPMVGGRLLFFSTEPKPHHNM